MNQMITVQSEEEIFKIEYNIFPIMVAADTESGDQIFGIWSLKEHLKINTH